MTTSQNDWFQEIPKVELHLHLEGAIPLYALWELVRKYGGDAQVSSMDALRRRFEYRDFAHFIELWHWKNGFIREYEDLTYAAEATARHPIDVPRRHHARLDPRSDAPRIPTRVLVREQRHGREGALAVATHTVLVEDRRHIGGESDLL